jgi:hypothetical protein
MIISVNTLIPFPRSLVYATYRDKVVELLPYLPNVVSVSVKSTHQEGNLTYYVNQWHGGGDIPAALRSILGDNLLSWDEYNTWNELDLSQKWHIKTHAFTESVSCQGTTQFSEDGNSTFVQTRGELTIDPKQIKGFPSFLVGGVAHMLEDFLGSKISPNLEQMSLGVRHYLEQNHL